MDLGGNFKDAFIYPTRNWKTFAIIGVLVILVELFTKSLSNLIGTGAISIGDMLVFMLGILPVLIISGYFLSVIRGTIHGSDSLPSVDIGKNILDTFKLLIIQIVYMVPIVIILVFSAFALNLFNLIIELTPYLNRFGSNYLDYVPESLLFDFGISVIIFMILVIILFIVFALILYIAQARLAKYDSLASAFEIKEILNDISEIGWGNYILWYLVFILIIGLLSFVYAFVAEFGIIGFIISSFLIYTYIQFFTARSIGLLYKNQ